MLLYAVEGFVYEVAHTAEHPRVRVSSLGNPHLEVHLEPGGGGTSNDLFGNCKTVMVCPDSATSVASSPYGPLDCVLVGEDKRCVLALDGEPVPHSTPQAELGVTIVPAGPADGECLDARGFVVTAAPWSRFTPGVNGLIDELPFPVDGHRG